MPSPLAPPSVRRAIGSIAAAAALLCVAGATAQADEAADVIIRGGTIHDGSGGEPFVGDVAIRGDRIVYVGPSRRSSAGRVIDASGMIVAPGFIDPHTHADSFIRSPDKAVRVNAAWLDQGVSTVMIGVDGSGTPDVAADAGRLAASGIGTNIVSFVGFGTFKTTSRKARSARNPRTGEPIKIPKRRVARFSPGTTLRAAVK